MAIVFIGLGANIDFLGRTPVANICLAATALRDFAHHGGEGDWGLSRLYQSAAWPNPDDPAFCNAVCRLETKLSPEALMAGLLAIEASFGRKRAADKPNAPRSLDLDIIDFAGEKRDGSGDLALKLPHPSLEQRLFVLLPLLDIAGEWVHPTSGISAKNTAERLIAALEPPDYAPIPLKSEKI